MVRVCGLLAIPWFSVVWLLLELRVVEGVLLFCVVGYGLVVCVWGFTCFVAWGCCFGFAFVLFDTLFGLHEIDCCLVVV